MMKRITHPPIHHHLASQLRYSLQVILRPAGRRPKNLLLCSPPSHNHRQLIHQHLLIVQILLLHRQLLRHAHRHTPWDNRHLVHWIRMLQHRGNQRMPGLMIRKQLPLLIVNPHTFALQTHHHLVPCHFDILR